MREKISTLFAILLGVLSFVLALVFAAMQSGIL